MTSQKLHKHAPEPKKTTVKLVENAISQALTKPQDSTPPNTALESRSSQTSNSSYEANRTSSWPTTNDNMQQHSNNDTYHQQRPYETHTSPHTYVKQQFFQPNLFQL